MNPGEVIKRRPTEAITGRPLAVLVAMAIRLRARGDL